MTAPKPMLRLQFEGHEYVMKIAYEAVKSEHDNLSKFAEDLRKERDQYRNDRDAMADRASFNGKRAFELQAERDALAAQLVDVKSVLEAVEAQAKKNSEYDDWRVSQANKRIANLEEALEYAKELLRAVAELERLERGEL